MKLLTPALLVLMIVSVGTYSCEPSADDCYTEIDTSQYKGILGDWYMVGIAEGEVNRIECFETDTTGISDIVEAYSFQISRTHYESGYTGASKCTYGFSEDYKTLYYYNYDGNTSGGDTTKLKVARLDSDYMVLIFPAIYEGQTTKSQLYLRKSSLW